jgi:two-component system, OmpR family, sensor kinase
MPTVRIRLTGSVLLLISVLGIALISVEYHQLRGRLVDGESTRLRAQATAAVEAAAGTGLDARRAGTLATELTSTDTGALVLTPDGVLLGGPNPGTVGVAPPREVPPAAVAAVAAGNPQVDVVRTGADGRELLVLVAAPGGPPAAVVVLSTSLAEQDRLARSQLLTGLVALAVALVVAAVASLLLVRRTLAPLRRIAESARRVAAGDLGERLHLPGPRDEVGSLAASFDAMTEALQRGFAELERSEQRSRSFVADASHELRTPLTTVAGFTDVLLRRTTDGDRDAARLLASLRREVDRMQRIVDDLLLLARADRGLATEREPVDLRAAAKRVVEQLRPVAGTRTLDVRGGPATARTDADRLHQVLLNLTENAIRHTGPDGTVLLATATVGDRVVITVTDDGEGMDEATLAAAFERFTRGGERRGHGAGLGLAIVAALVRALDGHVHLTSRRGCGTTVRVDLPAVSGTGQDAGG